MRDNLEVFFKSEYNYLISNFKIYKFDFNIRYKNLEAYKVALFTTFQKYFSDFDKYKYLLKLTDKNEFIFLNIEHLIDSEGRIINLNTLILSNNYSSKNKNFLDYLKEKDFFSWFYFKKNKKQINNLVENLKNKEQVIFCCLNYIEFDKNLSNKKKSKKDVYTIPFLSNFYNQKKFKNKEDYKFSFCYKNSLANFEKISDILFDINKLILENLIINKFSKSQISSEITKYLIKQNLSK